MENRPTWLPLLGIALQAGLGLVLLAAPEPRSRPSDTPPAPQEILEPARGPEAPVDLVAPFLGDHRREDRPEAGRQAHGLQCLDPLQDAGVQPMDRTAR